jgi:hypothetical protein
MGTGNPTMTVRELSQVESAALNSQQQTFDSGRTSAASPSLLCRDRHLTPTLGSASTERAIIVVCGLQYSEAFATVAQCRDR